MANFETTVRPIALNLDGIERNVAFRTSELGFYDRAKASDPRIKCKVILEGDVPLVTFYEHGGGPDDMDADSYTGSTTSKNSLPDKPGRFREARIRKNKLVKAIYNKTNHGEHRGLIFRGRGSKKGEVKVIPMRKYISVGLYWSNYPGFGKKSSSQALTKFKDEAFTEREVDYLPYAIGLLADLIKINPIQIGVTINFGKNGVKMGVMIVTPKPNAAFQEQYARETGIAFKSCTTLPPYGTLLPRRRRPKVPYGYYNEGMTEAFGPIRGRGTFPRGRGRGGRGRGRGRAAYGYGQWY